MLQSLQSHLPKINIPNLQSRVYKDECMFCFDSPETPGGLYVCLNTWMGFCLDHVKGYHERSGNAVFLLLRRIKKEVPEAEGQGSVPSKISRLAIGVEGGFPLNEKKYECTEDNALIVLPEFEELPQAQFSDKLPEQANLAIQQILAAESVTKLQELENLAGMWDGEVRKVSKHADSITQLDNGIKIPPSGWKCELCDKVDNLWLNLTDGKIMCGRKYFDGSGGNNHAVDHYNNTKYPLAVKLGTITPEGKADVYSYDEDDMVENPNLEKHLRHFGINMKFLEKTDKSMIELELDYNQRIGEWSTIQESSKKLKPLFGPGFTGLVNLGNSCYLNSVMQVVFTIPEFVNRYAKNADEIFSSSTDPGNDFNVQMAKLGSGLLSGKYSYPPTEEELASTKDIDFLQPGIKPLQFKNYIGKGHPVFSTKNQQDAQEYLLHLINMCERHGRQHSNPADAFKFKVEDRIECETSHCVKYTHRAEYLLPLPIPLEAATNRSEVEEYNKLKAETEAKGERMDPSKVVLPRISLNACFEAFAKPEVVHFYSTAAKTNTTALKTSRLATFPDYLFIHLKKFQLDQSWVPFKIDISMDMPDTLDLSHLEGKGLQPNETELPEEAAAQAAAVQIDENVVSQLMDMGFPRDGCRRAVFKTGNQGVEPAMNWVMEHMDDPDWNDPFQPEGGAVATQISEENIVMIQSMGFSRDQAQKALKATCNDMERAVDWIFSHPEELGPEEASKGYEYRQGPSKYKLVSFISHMGSSSLCGHYVCHILKDGRWVIYNDNKVALSEQPPRDLAYLYLYKRLEQ